MNETVKKELAEASEVCPTTTRGLLAKGALLVDVRSLKATYYLMYQGYEHVANMKHGMARWLERGFPVIGDVSKQSVKAGSACGCGDDSSQSAGSCCSDNPTDPKSESGCGASTAAGSCC